MGDGETDREERRRGRKGGDGGGEEGRTGGGGEGRKGEGGSDLKSIVLFQRLQQVTTYRCGREVHVSRSMGTVAHGVG